MLLRRKREHDYTHSMWGHALHSPKMVEITEPPISFWQKWFGQRVTRQILQALGHGNVEPEDTLLVRMASGRIARFVVKDIEYYSNPDDMFKLNRADFVDYIDGNAESSPS